ncbi:MAG TPA: DUF4345 domain-containing protein [Candidatus Limnocylindrales bacterium]|nr:DUF4345 domain-containing protein [Candidatus Limnocylindrales bacterium]
MRQGSVTVGRMRIQRILVALGALAFGAFGLFSLAAPATLLELIHAEPLDGNAYNDIRAMYGGAELAIAILLVQSLRRPQWLRAGLILQTVVFACMASARILSIALDGVPEPALVGAGAAELVAAVAGVLALREREAQG